MKSALKLLIGLILVAGASYLLSTLASYLLANSRCLIHDFSACSLRAGTGIFLRTNLLPIVAIGGSWFVYYLAGIRRSYIPLLAGHLAFFVAYTIKYYVTRSPHLGPDEPIAYASLLFLAALLWQYWSHPAVQRWAARLSSVATVAVPAVMVLASLVILLSTFKDDHHFQLPHFSDYVLLNNANNAAGISPLSCQTDTTGCLKVQLHEPDTSTRQIQEDVTVTLSNKIIRNITTLAGDSIATTEDTAFGPIIHIKPEYANIVFKFYADNDGVDLPLGSLDDTTPTLKSPFTARLDANSRAYPSDVYSTFGPGYRLFVPLGFTYHNAGHAQYDIPLSFAIDNPSQLRTDTDRDLLARPAVSSSGDYYYLAMIVKRDLQAKTFIYLIALSPLLVISTLVAMLLRHDRELNQIFLVEVSAALLAILPLRQVLVPPEVQGFTRIDYILGTELLIILALAMVKISRYLPSQLGKDPESKNPTPSGIPTKS